MLYSSFITKKSCEEIEIYRVCLYGKYHTIQKKFGFLPVLYFSVDKGI